MNGVTQYFLCHYQFMWEINLECKRYFFFLPWPSPPIYLCLVLRYVGITYYLCKRVTSLPLLLFLFHSRFAVYPLSLDIYVWVLCSRKHNIIIIITALPYTYVCELKVKVAVGFRRTYISVVLCPHFNSWFYTVELQRALKLNKHGFSWFGALPGIRN